MTSIGWGPVAALLGVVAPAAPAEAPADAASVRGQAVIAAFRAATGGDAWDRLDACYEQGTQGDGSIGYKTWFSMQRYGMRVESRRGAGPARITGFNGRVHWQSDGAGGVDVRRDEASLKEAVTTAYISSNGFFFPTRFPATVRYLREAPHAGRTFDVVEITPRGGRALDYWFDRASRLLLRVVDHGPEAPVVVEAADYRPVGEVRVAFSLVMTAPDGRVMSRGRLASLTCDPTDAALYDPPTGR